MTGDEWMLMVVTMHTLQESLMKERDADEDDLQATLLDMTLLLERRAGDALVHEYLVELSS